MMKGKLVENGYVVAPMGIEVKFCGGKEENGVMLAKRACASIVLGGITKFSRIPLGVKSTVSLISGGSTATKRDEDRGMDSPRTEAPSAMDNLSGFQDQIVRHVVMQYQAHILGLNAYDRHKKFLKEYVGFYGGESQKQEKLPVKTDQDTLRDGYRFIRSEEDDMDTSWEQRLVKRYYDKLFKEYCIADMSHYKTGKVGLRWRTEKEVISGKGQFVCGNKHCSEKEGLSSYEASVNFAYFEAGENKQALVKLVTCERCTKKLMYKKLKEKEQEKKEKEVHQKRKREREDDTSKDYERPKGKKSSAAADDVDNFDRYLQGMFP
ncbi:hypothetical protein E3N88_14197 [Mikania micrantha]|uniref:Protein FRA10AC1 n=1 Tax=Mikania micrantha TaxID=192012 RepID=A0A5N6P235_9ASTR|nr:hypothetical protein E3N88_14197 [Mikania micrantha]